MNILDSTYRAQIFKEIMCTENWQRKAEIYHAIQLYQEKQSDYITRSLMSEYNEATVNNMRKITSINLVRRIVNEKASIYKTAPERTITNASDQEQEQFAALYLSGKTNRSLKYSNRYFKYLEQVHMQVLPVNGVLKPRVLPGHMLDVVPMSNDPEEGEVYIVPIRWDVGGSGAVWQYLSRTNDHSSDSVNQIIADDDDDKLSMMRFAVWTKQHNFITNGNGAIIDPDTDRPFTRSIQESDLVSPVPGINTFIDISDQKDGVYWIDRGLNMAQFSIEFGKILSDTAETNRAQCFAQGIISALDKPGSLTVGPGNHMFLKKEKNTEPHLQPEFRFENPAPDLSASLDFLDRFLNYFLTSMDLDSSSINSSGDSKEYTSGLDRFLAMVDKFEASQDDIDIYNEVEHRLFEINRAWNNVLQDAESFEAGNMHGLKENLKGGRLSEDIEFGISFARPESTRTKKDIQEDQIGLLDNGLTTKKLALMEIHGITADAADEMVREIDSQSLTSISSMLGGDQSFGDQ